MPLWPTRLSIAKLLVVILESQIFLWPKTLLQDILLNSQAKTGPIIFQPASPRAKSYPTSLLVLKITSPRMILILVTKCFISMLGLTGRLQWPTVRKQSRPQMRSGLTRTRFGLKMMPKLNWMPVLIQTLAKLNFLSTLDQHTTRGDKFGKLALLRAELRNY